MRQWKVEYRGIWEKGKDVTPEAVTIEADSVCCEGGVAFFYVPDESRFGGGPRNRTIATVPLDVVLTIQEAK